jgi:PKD domain
MGVMARGSAVLVVLLAMLLPAGAHAQSGGYDFSVDPNPPTAGQEATFTLTPASADVERVRWDLDGDGEFDDGSSRVVRHTYASPGPVTVQMRAREDRRDPYQVVTKTIVVNGTPTANFSFTPAAPVTGEAVDFTPTVTDPDGDAVTLDWSFGDGATSGATSPSHTYSSEGQYTVVLTATDEHGAFTTRTHSVTVSKPPEPQPEPGPGPPPADQPPAGQPPAGPGPTDLLPAPVVPAPTTKPPVLMRPFPIVRIAGVVLRNGALIRILSVRAPRGSSVRVRCRGKGCPTAAIARTSATRLVRFHRFERRLPAGVRLQVFVRKAGRIGKYTRFLIRGGKPPARVDRCLMPGKRRPVRCA